jgi:hypothetical protein
VITTIALFGRQIVVPPGVQSLEVETWMGSASVVEGGVAVVEEEEGVAVVDGALSFAVAPVASVVAVVHPVKPIAIPVRHNAIRHQGLRIPPVSQGSVPRALSAPHYTGYTGDPRWPTGRTSGAAGEALKLSTAYPDNSEVKERNDHSVFLAAFIACLGAVLLVVFSGNHADCNTPLPADVPTDLRNCTRDQRFYISAWVLIAVAVIVAAFGVRGRIRRDRRPSPIPVRTDPYDRVGGAYPCQRQAGVCVGASAVQQPLMLLNC